MILALLVVSLLVGGLAKLIIAMTGVFLAVGPFVALGFRYRYGIAFRDGPIAGVLYMLFVPYRIHYRLTHQELFRNLRAPTLTLRDFGLLFLGLLFLPVIILAAQDMDKRARNRPPAVDWTKFASKPANFGIPPVPTRKRLREARPTRSAEGNHAQTRPDRAGAGRYRDGRTEDAGSPLPPSRRPSPPSPGRRRRGRHRHNPRKPTRWPAGPTSGDRGWAARFDPDATRAPADAIPAPRGPLPRLRAGRDRDHHRQRRAGFRGDAAIERRDHGDLEVNGQQLEPSVKHGWRQGDVHRRPRPGSQGVRPPDQKGVLWWDQGWLFVARSTTGDDPEPFLRRYLATSSGEETK